MNIDDMIHFLRVCGDSVFCYYDKNTMLYFNYPFSRLKCFGSFVNCLATIVEQCVFSA